MSHPPSPAVANWPALAVVGLLAGLLGSANPTPPRPTLPPTAGPAPTSAAPTVPTPAPSPWVTTKPTAATTKTGQVAPPRHRTPKPQLTPAAGVAGDDGAGRLLPDWRSYLPTPETGLKIFAGGLIGLTVAIAGLAALAIRRRSS